MGMFESGGRVGPKRTNGGSRSPRRLVRFPHRSLPGKRLLPVSVVGYLALNGAVSIMRRFAREYNRNPTSGWRAYALRSILLPDRIFLLLL